MIFALCVILMGVSFVQEKQRWVLLSTVTHYYQRMTSPGERSIINKSSAQTQINFMAK